MAEQPKTLDEPQLPPYQPKSTIAARLFSLAIMVYIVTWAVELIFIAKVFGVHRAMLLSLIPMIPLLAAVRMQLRWQRVNALDFVPLGLVVFVACFGVYAIVQSWYVAGYHQRADGWALNQPPSQEDFDWEEFVRAFAKDPSFRGLRIKHFRGTYWLSGSLNTESDLERLIELANKHRIKDRRLDGPYVHSISITIPGTNRARRYDTSRE